MTVGVVNYGLGNLASVQRALADLGADARIVGRAVALADVERIVLPGVGAFGEGMSRLRDGRWVEALRARVRDERTPLLGICLGMQLLAEAGEEDGDWEGLGLIAGRVRRLDALGCALRVPHVGWNDVHYDAGARLFAHVPQGTDFYFVHSYALEPGAGAVCATTGYGVTLAAAVQQGCVFGTQFHPEKSSKAGRQVLQNFLAVTAC